MRAASILSIFSFVSSLAVAGGAGTVGPGNPSAQLCSDLKGTTEYVKDQKGNDLALCVLDGAYVGQWTLFRHLKNKNHQLALEIFSGHPEARNLDEANPAGDYCTRVGGKISFGLDGDENKIGLCNFSDGSMIEAWTLLQGPKAPANKKLFQLIDSN